MIIGNIPELVTALVPTPSVILDSAGSKSCAPSSERLTCGLEAPESVRIPSSLEIELEASRRCLLIVIYIILGLL